MELCLQRCIMSPKSRKCECIQLIKRALQTACSNTVMHYRKPGMHCLKFAMPTALIICILWGSYTCPSGTCATPPQADPFLTNLSLCHCHCHHASCFQECMSHVLTTSQAESRMTMKSMQLVFKLSKDKGYLCLIFLNVIIQQPQQSIILAIL